ncbi:4-coumarate--CoA ligase-like 7 [Drosophila grimshawi]|uniref:GH20894 n=1 Tax=Drosophila grimshawi TaxID=7222 RepID=B4J4V6_DROGR|nr:4-coumarate--CoA ligase-like 7 [Drosophila grimshawi]EDW00652.1 GH20894 [Drosophila grimshawi]
MATKAFCPTFYDPETKIWRGAKRRPYYDPRCSVGDVIHTTLGNFPNQVIQINIEDGTKVTCLEIRKWGVRLAMYLKKEQITQTDIVGLISETNNYVVAVVVASFFNATPFHAVNVTRDAKTVQRLYEVTKPKIMFCDGFDYERIKEITKEWAPKIVLLSGRIEGVTHIEDLLVPQPEENKYQPAALDKDGNQTAAILCSSGTSGLPKAVHISHTYIARTPPLCKSTDIILTHATVDWATGFSCIVLSLFYCAPRLIFKGDYNAEKTLKIIQDYEATIVALAPWQAYELFTHPLATEKSLNSVSLAFITGGWISLKVLQRAQELMKQCNILFSYGSTETGGITGNVDQTLNNSVGRIFPGLRVRIVNDEGTNLQHNEVGEVLIDTGFKWQGYVNNVADTESTMQDGWINLGDLGYFDDDNNLYLVDRKKDLLKYKSKHYWPNEIEQVIIELPDVLNVCVVGVKDERHGDAAGALIIKKPGSALTKQQVIDHVAKRVVVDYKQLNSGVQFVDILPQNQNGKVMRSEARQLFEKNMN